jgi:tetracycline 7-halogenase / FADH2 O2-dependent halogenase
LQHNLSHFDKLVSYSYDSWADFRLWNAWFRVWVLGNFIGSSGVISRQLSYMRSGNARELARMEEAPYVGIAGCELPAFAQLFNAAAEKMEAFAEGELSAEQASDAIFGLLAKADFIPTQMRLAEPEHRSTSAFTTAQNMRLFLWGTLRAPDSMRQPFYTGVSPFDFFTLTARGLRVEIVHGMRTILASIRDHIRTWNAEWKHKRYDLPAPPRPVHHLTERNTTSRQEVRSCPELPKREAHPGGP